MNKNEFLKTIWVRELYFSRRENNEEKERVALDELRNRFKLDDNQINALYEEIEVEQRELI